MRLAWDEERKNRDQLLGELAKTREAAGKEQALLSEREKQARTFQQEAARLQQQFAEAQTGRFQPRALEPLHDLTVFYDLRTNCRAENIRAIVVIVVCGEKPTNLRRRLLYWTRQNCRLLVRRTGC